MKLSWKIVLVVLLIVTLTVSVSSYVMIAAAFQAELDSQASAAADERPNCSASPWGRWPRRRQAVWRAHFWSSWRATA